MHYAKTYFLMSQIVLEMILSQQLSSDLLNAASGTFYALICAYQVGPCCIFYFIFVKIIIVLFLGRIQSVGGKFARSTRS